MSNVLRKTGKEEIKLSLLADDKILFISKKIPNNTHAQTLLEFIMNSERLQDIKTTHTNQQCFCTPSATNKKRN